MWPRWAVDGARTGSRSDRFLFSTVRFLIVHRDILWVGGFDMDVETKVSLMNGQTFKLVCERCGSLTVALPIEAQPDPCSILKCGRCGSPRGTLQSLRDTSIQAGIRYPL